MIKQFLACSSALTGLCLATPLAAQTTHTVTASAETQEFSDDFGSLRTVQLEYKFENEDSTVVFTPTIGQRRASGQSRTAAGGGVALYRDWSDAVSTRTSVFAAEDAPVFAKFDVAQDVTVKIAGRTAVTVGGRYAQYFGNLDVVSASAGVRQYFAFGSVAYRATYVDPEARDSYFAHLVNFTINDPGGDGKTRLWLSAGEASISSAQVPGNFNGDEYAAVLQRVQPITARLALVPTLGYTSYDRLAGRVDAISIGLGVALDVD